MTLEEKIKFQIGDLVIACSTLKDQLEAAQAEVKRLKDLYEPEERVKGNGHQQPEAGANLGR